MLTALSPLRAPSLFTAMWSMGRHCSHATIHSHYWHYCCCCCLCFVLFTRGTQWHGCHSWRLVQHNLYFVWVRGHWLNFDCIFFLCSYFSRSITVVLFSVLKPDTFQNIWFPQSTNLSVLRYCCTVSATLFMWNCILENWSKHERQALQFLSQHAQTMNDMTLDSFPSEVLWSLFYIKHSLLEITLICLYHCGVCLHFHQWHTAEKHKQLCAMRLFAVHVLWVCRCSDSDKKQVFAHTCSCALTLSQYEASAKQNARLHDKSFNFLIQLSRSSNYSCLSWLSNIFVTIMSSQILTRFVQAALLCVRSL